MQLNSLFSDHAVLQRDIALPVWGCTKPNLRVRATLNGCTAETMAGPTGAFLVRLPPQAAGGPHTLAVETPDPAERTEVRDILIGEVWVCSGQSNMQFAVNAALPDPDPADVPSVRIFTVPCRAATEKLSDAGSSWKLAVSEEVPAFSAVGYFFARRLQRELGVPVGMLSTSWGGTRIEAWMSRDALMRVPRSRLHVEEFERRSSETSYWAENFGPFVGSQRSATGAQGRFPAAPDPGNEGEGLGWAAPGFDDSAWRAVNVPGVWRSLDDPSNGSYWYRRTVALPPAWKGRDLVLGVGAVDKHDVTYVNGERVGATGTGGEDHHWNVPRVYPVPAGLVSGGTATLAVRAFSFAYDGGLIGPSNKMFLRPVDAAPGEAIALDGEWRAQREHDIGLVVPPAAPMGPGNPNTPHILFDSMLAPLVPYAIRGAIWYQGESNCAAPREYLALQNAMLDDWRRAWGQGDFAFASVQLAAFRDAADFDPKSDWSLLRESQMQATFLPGVGMASAIDLGDAIDIHPRNKHDVGCRLARWALVECYGHPGPAMGPRPTGFTLEKGAVRVRFDNVGGGLVAREGGELRTVCVAGVDRRFFPARAGIEGTTVVAASFEVPEPVALRYAWADNPAGCNLYNAEGLPASPFRTDDW